jgi:hypothetical protein
MDSPEFPLASKAPLDYLPLRAPRGWWPADRKFYTILIGSILAGLICRLALASVSYGSNDFFIWNQLAQKVISQGLMGAYQSEKMMNHPPLPVLWVRMGLELPNPFWFGVWVKIPGILGDMLAIAVLGLAWIRRGDDRRAKLAMVAMALNPVAIIISGYHCNTDSLYAAMALLSLYFLDARCFFFGGLALGAAINVKLIPVLLIPVAFSLCRDWKQFGRLVGGLAIGVIPFVPLLLHPAVIRDNMLQYVPGGWYSWGAGTFIRDFVTNPPTENFALELLKFYEKIGRPLIIGQVLLLSIASWIWKRWDAYQLGTLVFAIFLIFAPAFGTQYAIAVVPALLAVSISRSWQYAAWMGLFLVAGYASHLGSTSIPFYTMFGVLDAVPMGAPYGMIAWWILLVSGCEIIIRRRCEWFAPAADDVGSSRVPDSLHGQDLHRTLDQDIS